MTQKPTWPIQSGQSGRDGVEYDLEEIDREEASPAFKHHQAWDLKDSKDVENCLLILVRENLERPIFSLKFSSREPLCRKLH